MTEQKKCRECGTQLTDNDHHYVVTDHDTHKLKGYECYDCYQEDLI